MAMKAKVMIRTGLRDGITRLRESYYTPPFKVANITEDKTGPQLHLMLMCSSPGILDGDEYDIRLHLEAGCKLQLHTQSYQRLFHMKEGASQLMEVHLEQGASCCYLPHPCSPHAHSIFRGRNKLFLAEGAQLIWGEVLTCGRKLSGEVFTFSKYQTITEVFCNNKLVLRENINLQPSTMDLTVPGQLEGFTHQGSLLFMGGRMEEGVRSDIQDYLSVQEGIRSGFSDGPAGSFVVRLLGNRAEQLQNCLKTVAGILSFTKPLAYAG
jgi:urease accessory protein